MKTSIQMKEDQKLFICDNCKSVIVTDEYQYIMHTGFATYVKVSQTICPTCKKIITGSRYQ